MLSGIGDMNMKVVVRGLIGRVFKRPGGFGAHAGFRVGSNQAGKMLL
jgi:hypothetical protein